jgi:hypothetical protein
MPPPMHTRALQEFGGELTEEQRWDLLSFFAALLIIAFWLFTIMDKGGFLTYLRYRLAAGLARLRGRASGYGRIGGNGGLDLHSGNASRASQHRAAIVAFEEDLDRQRRAAAAAAGDAAAAERVYRDTTAAQMRAEAGAQERYSAALRDASEVWRIEAEQDATSAMLNHQEAQRAASAVYAKELQEIGMAGKAATESLRAAMAPTQALKDAEDALKLQQARADTLALSEKAAKAAELADELSAIARREAATRANELRRKRREQERARDEFLDSGAAASIVTHAQVKPSLPRQKTVARSHKYGEGVPSADQPRSGWFSGKKGAASPGPGAVVPAEGAPASSSSFSSFFQGLKPALTVGLGSYRGGKLSPPRDVNNMYPHAAQLLEDEAMASPRK